MTDYVARSLDEAGNECSFVSEADSVLDAAFNTLSKSGKRCHSIDWHSKDGGGRHRIAWCYLCQGPIDLDSDAPGISDRNGQMVCNGCVSLPGPEDAQAPAPGFYINERADVAMVAPDCRRFAIILGGDAISPREIPAEVDALAGFRPFAEITAEFMTHHLGKVNRMLRHKGDEIFDFAEMARHCGLSDAFPGPEKAIPNAPTTIADFLDAYLKAVADVERSEGQRRAAEIRQYDAYGELCRLAGDEFQSRGVNGLIVGDHVIIREKDGLRIMSVTRIG